MTTEAMAKRVLSLEEIVAANAKIEMESVEVPELGAGAIINLRVLAAGEAIEFYEELKGKAAKNAMLKIVQACAIQANGQPLFPEAGGLDVLKRMNLKVVMRLQDAALKLNNLSPDKREQARLEAERKNDSGETEHDDSPTGSQ